MKHIILFLISLFFLNSCTQSTAVPNEADPPDPTGTWHTEDWSLAGIPVTLEFNLQADQSIYVLGLAAGDTGTIIGTWDLAEDEDRIDSTPNAMKLIAIVDSCASQNILVEQLICHEDTLALPFLDFIKDSLWNTTFLEYDLKLVPTKKAGS